MSKMAFLAAGASVASMVMSRNKSGFSRMYKKKKRWMKNML